MTTKEPKLEEISSDVMKEAEELSRRAIIQPDGVLGLARKLQTARNENRPLRVKLGIDPTGKDLHIGHAVVLRRLRRFQDFGHQAILIIGGATARIGDPTERDTTRPVLSAETVAENARTFLDQVAPILDLAKATVRNNAEWFDTLRFVDVLRIGTRISQAEMTSRFKARMESDNPPSVTETMYPLMQGWDSLEIKADIEIGGTDQLSNLHMGRKIQQIEGQDPQIVLMLPILPGTDGEQKMSKSFGNAITLSDTAHDIFGKTMSIPDSLAASIEPGTASTPRRPHGMIVDFLELATMLPADVLESEKQFLKSGGNPRDVKERLAHRIVLELRGQAAADEALNTWHRMHREKRAPESMPSHSVPSPIALVSLLVSVKLAVSNREARQFIKDGAVSIDGEKIRDIGHIVTVGPNESLVLNRGSRADKFIRLVNEQPE